MVGSVQFEDERPSHAGQGGTMQDIHGAVLVSGQGCVGGHESSSAQMTKTDSSLLEFIPVNPYSLLG